MNKLLLIAFPSEFYKPRLNLYEIKSFINQGYEVEVHELTNIIYGNFKSSRKDIIDEIKLKKFHDIKEWKNELRKINSLNYKSVIVFSMLHPYFWFKNGILFKTLKLINGNIIGFLNPGIGNLYYRNKPDLKSFFITIR